MGLALIYKQTKGMMRRTIAIAENLTSMGFSEENTRTATSTRNPIRLEYITVPISEITADLIMLIDIDENTCKLKNHRTSPLKKRRIPKITRSNP